MNVFKRLEDIRLYDDRAKEWRLIEFNFMSKGKRKKCAFFLVKDVIKIKLKVN